AISRRSGRRDSRRHRAAVAPRWVSWSSGLLRLAFRGGIGIEEEGRVDHPAIETHRPVQVRPGDPAGGADRADRIAGRDPVTWPDFDGAQMTVHREQAAAMVEPDRLAVEEIIAGVDDAAVGRGDDGRSGGGRDVHPAVRAPRLTVED